MGRHVPIAGSELLSAVARVRSHVLFDVSDLGELLLLAPTESGSQLSVIDGTGSRALMCHRRVKIAAFLGGGSGPIAVQHDDAGDGLFSISLVDRSGKKDLVMPGNAGVTFYLINGGDGWFSYVTNRRGPQESDLRIRFLDGRDHLIFQANGFIFDATVLVESSALDSEVVHAAVTVLKEPGWASTLYGCTYRGGQRDEHVICDSGFNEPGGWDDDGSLLFTTDHLSDRSEIWRAELGSSGLISKVFGEADADCSIVGGTSRNGYVIRRTSWGEEAVDASRPGVPIIRGGTVSARVSPNGRYLACLTSDPTVPTRLMLVDRATESIQEVRSTSVPLAEDLSLRVHRAPAQDGEVIPIHHYWSPSAIPEGEWKSAPTVVLLHGGPQENERSSFSPLRLVMAAHGYHIIAPDVRGSTGYGRRWYGLDDGRLRVDAIEDVRSVHSYLRGELGLVGPAFLIGASYGGYLVLCGLTMQSSCWAGGVDVMGMASMTTYLERTAEFRRAIVEAEYGSLSRDRAFLEQISPINHVSNMTAPVLMIHGALDFRIPLSESEDFHDAAQSQGIDAALEVFDDESHGITSVENWVRLFELVLGRLAEWRSRGSSSFAVGK